MKRLAVGLAVAFVAALAAAVMGLFVLVVGVADVNLLPSGNMFRSEGASAKSFRFAVPPLERRRAVNKSEVYPHDCSREKCIALTFDDGPVKGTGKVLDALKRQRARATFFVLGEMVREEPGMLRRQVAEGHEIGNHTWDHRDLSRMTAKQIRRELQRTADLVKREAGVTPRLMRAPYGSSSKRVVKVARAFGLPQILWAVDPQDWRDHRPESIARRVLKDAQPGQIILMHDIQAGTVKAVPRILRTLKRRGYVFATVSELLASGMTVPGGEYRDLPEQDDEV